MNKMTWLINPTAENSRNSEGDFQRDRNGDILFAYSSYGAGIHDHDACNIALIRSSDEGETWSEPVVIAPASDFGVKNVMCVCTMPLKDGTPAFYFLIKENDGNSTMGRVIENEDGTWRTERCGWKIPTAYYVIENARLRRFPDGTLYIPASYHNLSIDDWRGKVYLFYSRDDGATFEDAGFVKSLDFPAAFATGLQEPGIERLPDGRSWIYARTTFGCQYEMFAEDGSMEFTDPTPSLITSPLSPMASAYAPDGKLYIIYNPVPNYNGRGCTDIYRNRTPLGIRKSADGVNFGEVTIVEPDDGERSFTYPSLFFTNDGSVLCSYNCGPDLVHLTVLGIRKISLSEIKD